MTIPTLYLFIYLSKLHYGDKNSKTRKARNLKFGDMISLYMKLCACNFGGATSRALGQMHHARCQDSVTGRAQTNFFGGA